MPLLLYGLLAWHPHQLTEPDFAVAQGEVAFELDGAARRWYPSRCHASAISDQRSAISDQRSAISDQRSAISDQRLTGGAELASAGVLDRAFVWVCRRRRAWPDGADVWDLRWHWPAERARLQRELRDGSFRFGVQTRVRRRDGTEMDLWAARDAVVLKALAWVLAARLALSRRCTHLRGHGGAAGARRLVRRHLGRHRFVLRTDVASYYDSVDHGLLLDRLARAVRDRRILRLVGQYLRRTVERGGLYTEITRGLSLGCPLSPLMGAFFLAELDARMERAAPSTSSGQALCYVRFMDDVLVLAPTRWRLRRAARVLNATFDELRLAKHPGKTFIGRVEKGFEFLGCHFTPHGLSVARATRQRFLDRAHRLYERGRRSHDGFRALGAYVRHWTRWARAAVGSPTLVRADCTTEAEGMRWYEGLHAAPGRAYS